MEHRKKITPLTILTTKIIPLPLKNIDTDMIIPAQHLKSTARTGYGKFLFERLREQDSSFPLNLPKYQGAQALLTRENFGCGSSREHAVWALQEAGIRFVVAPSFADIITANAANNGLALITLSSKAIDELFLITSREEAVEVSLDLEKERLSCAEYSWHFMYDPFRKYCLMNGLDTLDYLLAEKERITSFHQKANHFFVVL